MPSTPSAEMVWRPQWEPLTMCNLYSQTRTQEAMRQLFQNHGWRDRTGNLEPGGVYPDQQAPIIRNAEDGGLELVKARWGMPTPPQFLKTERDPGVTNIRNTASPHWRRWLDPAHRCLMPLTSFAEPRGKGRGNQWLRSRMIPPRFSPDWRRVPGVRSARSGTARRPMTCSPS